MNKHLLLFCALLISLATNAQTPQILKLREYTKKQEKDILNEFVSFLSIPNVGSDHINIRRNADSLVAIMNRRGIKNVQLLGTPDAVPVPPVVYGEVNVPGATRTIVFYAHYDGQPVDPSQWEKDLSPFVPTFRDGRIYARGSSDDKGGVLAILNAYSAIVNTGEKPTCNIKFFFEGEEERGSPNLSRILEKYSTLLKSDLWIICDGPVHQSGKKQIVLGVRGVSEMEITVYGAIRPLHSGHYGNWAPNPAMQLAKLLASMKSDEGKVIVDGFYDDMLPITPLERSSISKLPPVDEDMKNELGIKTQELPGINLYEAIMFPSLNIRGMQSANVGDKASNVIPTTATATIDLRLVPGNDAKRQQQKVVEHIKKQGFHVTDKLPTPEERKQFDKIAKITLSEGYNAMRTPLDNVYSKGVLNAVQSATKEQVLIVPTMGGSLPLIYLEKYLGAKIIILPIANHDNNQHAENENLRLQNFREGIELLASVMLML